jgi:hypothetical protein
VELDGKLNTFDVIRLAIATADATAELTSWSVTPRARVLAN